VPFGAEECHDPAKAVGGGGVALYRAVRSGPQGQGTFSHAGGWTGS
jgi:hypothetical protein